MNGAGGVNEIWGKDGGEREIGGGEKNFCNWQRGRGGKRKGEWRKKILKLSVHTKKYRFDPQLPRTGIKT